MNVGDTLYAVSEAGLTLTASMTEDTLKVYPPENITPELAATIKGSTNRTSYASCARTRRCAAPASSSPSARSSN